MIFFFAMSQNYRVGASPHVKLPRQLFTETGEKSERVIVFVDHHLGNPSPRLFGVKGLHFRESLHSHKHHFEFISLRKSHQGFLAHHVNAIGSPAEISLHHVHLRE